MAITIDTLPDALYARVGPILDLDYPVQGATSDVVVLRTRNGVFAAKRATQPPFTDWLQREWAVLQALTATSLPVPRVHTFVERERQQGSECWLLMDYLPGETLRTVLRREHDAPIRHNLLTAFGSLLATVHRCVPPAGMGAPGQTWLDRMLDRAEQYLQQYVVDGTSGLLQRLRTRRPPPVPECLIHGDYTLDNVLVQDGILVGLIDWAGGASGDPRYDLALATKPRPEAFQTALEVDAFYAGYGGTRLTREEADYFVGLYEFF
jgi:aminoglycoside phosphotransferase (APT) family kinase protein